jgi:rhodanese-related sulfurtransferase
MEDIDVQSLKQKLDCGEDIIFIDVREPYEFEEFNLGASLVPLGQFISYIPELLPHKDKEIIIHCRSGVRSASAKQTLVNLGFSNVRNVLGGVLEWKRVFGA